MLTHLMVGGRWSVALESITHVEEEEIKHVLVLPDSTNVMIEVDADLSDL